MADGPLPSPLTGNQLDGSTFGAWKPTPINPLKTVTDVANLRHQRLENQKIQAQRAAGADYQAAIDPNTGRFSLSRFHMLLGGDHPAALAAPAADQTAIKNAHDAFDHYMEQYDVVARAAGSVLAIGEKDPSKMAGAFKSELTDLVTKGLVPAKMAAAEIAAAPLHDPKALHQYVLQAATQLMQQKQSAEYAAGKYEMIDAGGQLFPARVPALGPANAAGAPINKSVSPETAVGLHPVVNKKGTPFQVTGEALAKNLGHGDATTNPLNPNAPRPSPGTGPLNGGNAAVPPGQVHQYGLAPIGGAPAAKTAKGAGGLDLSSGIVQGPAPGTVEGLKGAAEQNVQISNQIVDEGKDVGPTIANLTELGSQIDAAQPGPLAKPEAIYGAIAAEAGIKIGKQATAEQIFSKLTNVLAEQSLTNLGRGTDKKLETSLHATPNTAMTKEAAKTVWATAMGQKEYRRVRYEEYQKWLAAGNLPSHAAEFNAKFQKQISPLTAALPYMPRSQQGEILKFVKKLPPTAKKEFWNQIAGAQRLGLWPQNAK